MQFKATSSVQPAEVLNLWYRPTDKNVSIQRVPFEDFGLLLHNTTCPCVQCNCISQVRDQIFWKAQHICVVTVHASHIFYGRIVHNQSLRLSC